MNAVAFDALKFATALQEQDAFSAVQSARLAAVLSEAIDTEIARKSDIRESELRLVNAISESKADLAKWMVGAIGFQTVAILGAVGAVMTLLHVTR